MQTPYLFSFTIEHFGGTVHAVSVAQAVARAKAIFVRDGLGYAINTDSFKAAVARLRVVPVRLTLDPIARQRFSELYREQYQIGITNPHDQAEFTQLESIVNKLSPAR